MVMPDGCGDNGHRPIPQAWRVVELGDICSMKSGETITAARINDDLRYPCYGANGLRGFTDRFTHDGEYVLIGRQGALCGNVLSVSGKFFASEHAVVAAARPGVDTKFLAYLLGELNLNRYSESSAQPGLSVSRILKLPVAIPQSGDEQRGISLALTDLDATLESLDRLIVKKLDIKQAVMQQLLTARTRLPGFSDSWDTKTLGQLGDWKGGVTPSMARSDFWEDGTVPWISSGDVKTAVLSKTARYATTVAVESGAAVLVPANSIIVVTRSGILRKYLPVAMTATKMAINQDIKALMPDNSYDPNYLLHALSASGPLILASCMKFGTTVESVELRWLKAFEIGMPRSIEEQRAIAAVLSEMDAEIGAIETRRHKLANLKKAIMQELLTGKTRIFSSEPAYA